MLFYLQWGQRSSSPHPPHRQPTASPCSSARSVRQESDIHADTRTRTHTQSHAFKEIHTRTHKSQQVHSACMCNGHKHTIHNNKCISHEKPKSPAVYNCNSFTVKLLLYLFTVDEIAYMSGGIWQAIIGNPGLSVEIME